MLKGAKAFCLWPASSGYRANSLHDWIKAWKAHGPEGLNRKRGPKPGLRKLKPVQADDNKRSALAQASVRIAELERLVGRQQLDIDFFRKALQRLGAAGSARQIRIPIIEVIEAVTLGSSRIARRCTAAVQARRPAARDLLPAPCPTRRSGG